jgi:prepilin-type N-terminal cleavage/methylation domain-containing protein
MTFIRCSARRQDVGEGQIPPKPRPHRGVTLIETMIVVTIIGILASMGVPRFEQAIEQSRANIAAANLRAIWTGQRAYWLQNNTFSPDLATLRSANLLDPGIVDDNGGSTTTDGSAYVYQISQSAASTFQATARRVNAPGSQGTLTIDQNGDGSGTIQMTFSGGVTITPSFF